MKSKMLVLLGLCLLLAGCGKNEAPDPAQTTADTVQESAPAGDTTEASGQDDETTVTSTFRVMDDTMVLMNSDALTIRGTRLSADDPDSGLAERFQEAESANGVLPACGAVTLQFKGEMPLQITWYLDDGYGFTDKGTVVSSPQSRTTIYLGPSAGSTLSSDTENIPVRKLRIVCRYLNRSVEYLMLMDAV